MKEITDQTFEAEVQGDLITIVDFWAPWCGPCKMVAAELEKLEQERSDVSILKINVDENPEIPKKFNVRAIPTLKIFQNGDDVGTIIGAVSKATIVARIDSLTMSES